MTYTVEAASLYNPRRDNDRYVIESTGKTKAMWKLINREIGKAPENDHKLELRVGKIFFQNPLK
jgi:hypothetical protein